MDQSVAIPEWVQVKQQLTRDDMVRDGVCFEGMTNFCRDNKIIDTAMAVSALRELSEPKRIEKAARLSGGGSGYGYGYGSGYGSGYSYGSGSGYGYGYSYSYGYGYGDGSGYGYGYGYSYGYGLEVQS